MDYLKYEMIKLKLKSSKKIDRENFHYFLLKRLYKPIDNFYKLKRDDFASDYQGLNVCSLRIFLKANEIYETEEDIEEGISTYWDELELSYLLASLPRKLIDRYIEELRAIKDEFALKLYYEDTEIELEDIQTIMNKMADELDENETPAGSEVLDYLIGLEYPRT